MARARAMREAEVAARWSAGDWRGVALPATDGHSYTVVYEGRRGGGAGPDFRDAVLTREDGTRLRGDIELHLRASAWRAHGHERDPRYNGVLLHVVAAGGGGSRTATRLANGQTAPLAVLVSPAATATKRGAPGPCANLAQRIGTLRLIAPLHMSGSERFERRTAAFASALAAASPIRAAVALWPHEDCVLWVALAEALAFGRDRETLREAGVLLAAGMSPEEIAARWTTAPHVERRRIAGLLALRQRWLRDGPAAALGRALATGTTPGDAARAVIRALGVEGGDVSPGRAAILAVNVALPFAAARAESAGEAGGAAWAHEVYAAMPGLPSNTITRLMARQFGMTRLPAGALAQQGLHHVWAEHCREKRCGGCPCAIMPP